MGSGLSCIPHQNLKYSSKSYIRRKSSQLFRKKNPQEGQVKSNSIINILCTVTPRKEMSPKDLKEIENIKWEPPYDPSSGWKKSSTSVKNYGRMIYSSKVRFRFLHCQDIHDCYLDLFQTHLHFLSNNTTGLTYQGTLPLKDLTICKLQGSCGEAGDPAFQIDGVGLNPIIVYCAGEAELETWFGQIKEQVELNGGTVASPKTEGCMRSKKPRDESNVREELRNSVKNEPIYEWEGSQRESLGPITYVTKAQLQHLPCQEQYERLLVLYPTTLIILSDESNGLFYKGKLPLNMISVSTCGQKPNSFRIEGKLINPIIVSCLDECEFHDWICHLIASHVPVQGPAAPVYDIIYTPTKKEAPELDPWSRRNSQAAAGPEQLRNSHTSRNSSELPFRNQPDQLPFQSHPDQLLSPGYTEPLCYSSSRPASSELRHSRRLSGRSSSMSSAVRPALGVRPPSAHCSSPTRSSHNSATSPPSSVYNLPYIPLGPEGALPVQDKLPLVKSNSWSTPQTSIKYQPSIPQRHSDLCAPRQPLSPLYDDPYTPGKFLDEDNYLKPAFAGHDRGVAGGQQGCSQALPPSFRLCTPPQGRRKRNTPAEGQEARGDQWVAAQRAEAVSKLKLLPAPTVMLGYDSSSKIYPLLHQQMPRDYLLDESAYLKPAEPDDQDMDYDNIWDFDSEQNMSHPLGAIAPGRTTVELGGRDVISKSTHKRWS
nr:PREDICTED: pleckstrin homology domain-containing family N member 1 [Lepisosteus oculatus]